MRSSSPSHLTRASFLTGAGALALAAPLRASAFELADGIHVPKPAFPGVPAPIAARYSVDPDLVAQASSDPQLWRLRRLWLVRKGYPNEVADGVPFCVDGEHLFRGTQAQPGYNWLCWILRDHNVPWREGYVPIDIVTIQAMWEVQQIYFQLGISAPITITDGYRTPETNRQTEGAARNSQHMHMKAVDMYVDGMSAADLFHLCYSRRITCGDIDHRTPDTGPGDTCGGVGYYNDGHVHLDSASRRYWIN